MIAEANLQFFSGFYGSIWDYSDDLYCFEEEHKGVEVEMDDEAYMTNVCKNIVDIYNSWLKKIELNGVTVEFVCVDHPSAYNYTNDSIVVNINVTDEGKDNIMKMLRKNYDIISGYIEKECSSCDGYWSWLDNDIDKWDESKLFDDSERHQPAYLSSVLDYIIRAEFKKAKIKGSLDMLAYEDVEIRFESYISFKEE